MSSTCVQPRVDQLLPQGSRIRADILSFCKPKTVLKASKLSDAWFNASAHPHVWQPHFDRHEAHNHIDQLPELQSPGMYIKLMDLPTSDNLMTLWSTNESQKMIIAIATLVARSQNLYTEQLPTLLLLLHRHQLFQIGAHESNDSGITSYPPWVLLLTGVVRWYKILACPDAMVPWMLAIYRWAGAAKIPLVFHKVMLAPVMNILAPSLGIPPALKQPMAESTPLPEHVADEILDLTEMMAERYLKPGFETSYVDGKDKVSSTGSDSTVQQDGTATVLAAMLDTEDAEKRTEQALRVLGLLLPNSTLKERFPDFRHPPVGEMSSCKFAILDDKDPRLVFGVFYYVVKRNPSYSGRVTQVLVDRWGTGGLEEYAAACRRIEYLTAVQKEFQEHVAHAKPKASTNVE